MQEENSSSLEVTPPSSPTRIVTKIKKIQSPKGFLSPSKNKAYNKLDQFSFSSFANEEQERDFNENGINLDLEDEVIEDQSVRSAPPDKVRCRSSCITLANIIAVVRNCLYDLCI